MKRAAASPHKCPWKKSCVSPRKELTARVLSNRLECKWKLWPPNSTAAKRRGDPLRKFAYTKGIEWNRRDRSDEREEHFESRAHLACRARVDPGGVLGRCTFWPSSTCASTGKLLRRLQISSPKQRSTISLWTLSPSLAPVPVSSLIRAATFSLTITSSGGRNPLKSSLAINLVIPRNILARISATTSRW